MSLSVFYASALIWAFLCVLVAIVAGAAVGGRMRHWRAALAGLLVGVAFGVTIVALISVVGAVSFSLALLLQSLLNSFAIYFAGILLSVAAAAFTGLAVGLLERRSAAVVCRCVIVGIAFGLVLGIANTAVSPLWANVLVPALESLGVGRFSAAWFGTAVMATGVAVDIALAVAAFRLVRRRWGSAPTATATGTC